MNKLAAKTITTWAAIREGYLRQVHRRMQEERGLATLEYVILGAAIVAVVLIVGTQIRNFIQGQANQMTGGGNPAPAPRP